MRTPEDAAIIPAGGRPAAAPAYKGEQIVQHRSPALLRPFLRHALAAMACVVAVMPGPARAIDWNAVQGAEIPLFYPGLMSWEKVLTAASHKGATKFRAGETCAGCHAGEEAEMGAAQAKPDGYAGRSSLTVQLKAAVADGSLHFQLSGPAVDGKAPAVALMLGNDALKSTAQAGCWAACHDDAPGMASDSGLKLGKYLPRSRSRNTATGGGDSVRPQAELDAALAAGEFLELMEVDAAGKGERALVGGPARSRGLLEVAEDDEDGWHRRGHPADALCEISELEAGAGIVEHAQAPVRPVVVGHHDEPGGAGAEADGDMARGAGPQDRIREVARCKEAR